MLAILVGSYTVTPYHISYFRAEAKLTPTSDLTKILVDRAIQALQSGNVNETMHSKAAEQELLLLSANTQQNNNNPSSYNNSCFSSQSRSTLLLVNAVIQSLEKGNDISKALLFLNLAER
jgi:hypothetical protein